MKMIDMECHAKEIKNSVEQMEGCIEFVKWNLHNADRTLKTVIDSWEGDIMPLSHEALLDKIKLAKAYVEDALDKVIE